MRSQDSAPLKPQAFKARDKKHSGVEEMIAVTGAAGELGSRVAARLSRLGLNQRMIVRDPARAPHLPGAEIAQASSYIDAAAMRRALNGIE